MLTWIRENYTTFRRERQYIFYRLVLGDLPSELLIAFAYVTSSCIAFSIFHFRTCLAFSCHYLS